MDVAFELSCAVEFGESDNVPDISNNVVGRARNVWVRGLWGEALLYLQSVLLEKHKSPGTSAVLELICNDDIFGQGGHNTF